MEQRYLVIIACVLVAAFLLYKETKRADKRRLVWRLLASFVAVCTFAILIVPISYQVKITGRLNEMILITPGTPPDTIKKYRQQTLYATDRAIVTTNPTQKIRFLPDLLYFLQTNKMISKLNIYGIGLAADELKQIENQEVNFYPVLPPNGIISCNWNQQIKSTENMRVQGMYNNASSKTIKLVLFGLGSRLDSAIIKPKDKFKFSFQHRPQQLGRAIYQLIAFDGKDTVLKEKIPFTVTEEKPMHILMLASFPDFEYKFLKDWLYANNYPLIFRSRISKDKYSISYLNTKSKPLNRIGQPVLEQTDVLIIDETELAALSRAEINAINSQVQQGMGLLIRIGENSSKTVRGFSFYQPQQLKQQSFLVKFFDDEIKLKPLTIEQPLFVKTRNDGQPLVRDQAGRILVNSRLNGTGKIVVSAIPATYLWTLAGNNQDYALFWSQLLNKTARKAAQSQSWEISPALPITGGQTEAIFESDETSRTPAITFNKIRLSPLQNMHLPFRWQTTFWPQSAGWNKLSSGDTPAHNFYVYDKDDWKAIADQDKLNATMRLAAKQDGLKTRETERTEQKQVSKWWFFLMFLIAAGFLWYETRLGVNS